MSSEKIDKIDTVTILHMTIAVADNRHLQMMPAVPTESSALVSGA